MIDNLDDALEYYKGLVREERRHRDTVHEGHWRDLRFACFHTLNLLGFGDAALQARNEVEEEGEIPWNPTRTIID